MTLKLTQLNPLSFILPLAQLKHPKKYMVSPNDKTLKFKIDKLSRLKIMNGRIVWCIKHQYHHHLIARRLKLLDPQHYYLPQCR